MSSFIAAGTAYATLRRQHDPVLHLLLDVRLPADRRPDLGRRRLTRSRLPARRHRRPDDAGGEGLQHQDGHSQVLFASRIPTCVAYDPAFAYELAVIIQDGIRRMYGDQESIFYYLTVMNEAYEMASMPDGPEVRDGILRGIYRFSQAKGKGKLRAQLIGSGAILPEVIKAQAILAEKYGVQADVWSATSYNELYRDGHACERWNMLHPGEAPRVPFVTRAFADTQGPIVAASDYLKVLPDLIDRWLPRPLVSLGTDGFGRSESRASLRNHFEVDARFVTVATLAALVRDKQLDAKVLQQAIADLEIDSEKVNPALA